MLLLASKMTQSLFMSKSTLFKSEKDPIEVPSAAKSMEIARGA